MARISRKTSTDASDSQVIAMQEAFDSLKANHSLLLENLADVQMMLDASGWVPMFDYTTNGMSKHQINIASRQLRELVVGSPTMKKGVQLRHGYIHGKGFTVDTSTVKTQVAKERIAAFKDKTFSPLKLEEWTKADYTDGNFMVIGDNKTKKTIFVPIEQITGVYVDGDDRSEVIAFQRSWISIEGAEAANETSWYFTDTYDGPRSRTLVNVEGPKTVDTGKTIFWNPVNRQSGWTWGVPDALPAVAWARLYRDFLENGEKMSAAMAKIAFTLTAKTRAGGQAASAAIAGSQSAAQTAALPSTMGLSSLPSAGKSYDFEAGDRLAAMIASAIEVSVEDLLSLPDSDKADGIPAHVKRAMRVRQQINGAFIKRILVWFGAPATICIEWPEIDDMDAYRKHEMLTGAWGTGLLDPEEAREPMADNAGITLTKTTAPPGVLIPNNLATVEANKPPAPIAADPNGDSHKAGPDVKPDGSNAQHNGQGRDSQGTGQHSAGNNDLRDGTTKK